MEFFTLFISLIALATSLINIIFLIKSVKKFNEKESFELVKYDEENNKMLAQFQKITSTRLRALDNKIEIVDQLLKDMNEAYSRSCSVLTEVEKTNDEKFHNNLNTRNKNLNNQKEVIKEDIKKTEEIKEKIDEIKKEDIKIQNELPIMDKNTKILSLYKKGLTPSEIGKKLDIGVGEVMLVINLYN